MKTLDELRAELDGLDAQLMRLFAERMDAARRIGEQKRVLGLPITDPEREEQVVSSRLEGVPEEAREGGERLVRLLMEESKKVQRRGQNLYLIGMPDCGKTRTGKKLKALLGLPLADTDKLIESNTGLSIDEIFARFGEKGFREMETAVLRAAAKRGGMCVATGGGLPIWEGNASIMRYSGVTVFLDRALSKLHGQRTTGRPLISADTPEQVNANIDRLYYERHEKYLSCADLTLDPDAEGAAERIAQAYLRWLESGIL